MKKTKYEPTHLSKTILAIATVILVLAGLAIVNSERKSTAASNALSKPQAGITLPGLTVTLPRTGNSSHVDRVVIPKNIVGRGVITLIGSTEDALKKGLGVIKVSIIGSQKLHLIPGKPMTIWVKITYIGGPTSPEKITLNLGKGCSSSKGYIFVPLKYIDIRKLPPGMRMYSTVKPIVYKEKDNLGNPHYVLIGYRKVTGYYILQNTLFKFSTQHITIHKNSSVILKVELVFPSYVKGGIYSISPPVDIERTGIYMEEESLYAIISNPSAVGIHP